MKYVYLLVILLVSVTNAIGQIVSARATGGGPVKSESFTNIPSAMASCPLGLFCPVAIPPTASPTLSVPGYMLDPNQPPSAFGMRPNTTVYDSRFGDARLSLDAYGITFGLTNTPNGWIFDYSKKASPNAIHVPLYLLMNVFDGGTNAQNSTLQYTDKTTYAPLSLSLFTHSPGQHINLGMSSKSFSLGDTLGIANYLYCFGGFNAQADEGCEAQDNQVFQGNVEYGGVVTAATASSVTVTPNQGLHTQGAGRFLAKTSTTISAGTIISINPAPPAQITGSGTSWPVSTMIGTLGTAVPTPGVATVTPSFTTGSFANLSLTSLVCVADGAAFEMLNPASLTPPTMTANFAKAHTADAMIASGGVCGYLLDLSADDVGYNTFPNHAIQDVPGVLHFSWPAIASTSPTSLILYVAGGGAWQSLVSRWDPNTANLYTLFPMAEVTSVQQGGGLSDTLTVGPNNGFAPGDTVSEFLYPANHFTFGNNVITAYYPNFRNAAGGFGLTYNMPLQGNDTMLGLINGAPNSMYRSFGGKYDAPWGIHVQGQTNYGIFFDQPGAFTSFGIGCNPCGGVVNVMAAANGQYYDFIQYDQGHGTWQITASNNQAHYGFGLRMFSTPFPNVMLGVDSGNTGYVATQSIRTGAAYNTDLAGELSFVLSTTQTYTMVGAYYNHPECWAYPQFNLNGTQLWISYGTGSFTINASAPVTGVVSYGCTARN